MTAVVNTSTGEIVEQLSLDETDALGRAEYRAYQLIEAAAITGAMSTIVDTPLPANEGRARELSGLPPEQAADVMRETFDRTDGNVTARSIRETRQSSDADALTATPRGDGYYEMRPLRVAVPRGEPSPKPATEEWDEEREADEMSASLARGVVILTAATVPERNPQSPRCAGRMTTGATPPPAHRGRAT